MFEENVPHAAVAQEPVSTKEKVGRTALSGLLGAVVGVAIAEIVANSLIEISLSPVFSIVRHAFCLYCFPSLLGEKFLCCFVFVSDFWNRFLLVGPSFGMENLDISRRRYEKNIPVGFGACGTRSIFCALPSDFRR
jgi:hypothetical protein